MPDLAAELWAVQHLASLCNMNISNIAGARTVLGSVEHGIDVVFDMDGQRIGAQHTIFHGDEGLEPGKRGSFARATEERTARTAQGPFYVPGVIEYRTALTLRIQEKCAKSDRYHTHQVVSKTWLIVSASLGQWGACASTFIVPELVQTGDLNRLFHDLLCDSWFDRVYLLLHTANVAFEWTREGRWRRVADPGAQERDRQDKDMNDLIFRRIPDNRRRGWSVG